MAGANLGENLKLMTKKKSNKVDNGLWACVLDFFFADH